MQHHRNGNLPARNFLCVALAMICLNYSFASADLFPGDCGKASSTSGASLSATDANQILRGGVGLVDCVPYICDMTGDGTVATSDALAALRVAVSLVDYANVDNCPTTCPADVCTCTAATLIQRLRDLGTGKRLAPGVGVLLRCPPNTTISVTDTNSAGNTDSWDDADTSIEQSSLWVSALGATNSGNVTLELGPTCDQRCLGQCQCTANSNCASGESCSSGLCTCNEDPDCPGSSCDSGVCSPKNCTQDEECTGAFSGSLVCDGPGSALPDTRACTESGGCNSYGVGLCTDGHYRSKDNFVGGACPSVDAGQTFLTLAGDNITVAGLTVRGFFEGIHFGGHNGTVRDTVLDRQCDDSITNNDGQGWGSIVQSSTIKRGCDKCTQDYAGPAISGSCVGRDCYHIQYDDVDFLGCAKPLRVTDAGTYIRVANSLIDRLGSGASSNDFWCQESKFDGGSVISSIENTKIDHCESGFVYAGGASFHDVLDSYVTHSTQRALDARGNPGTGIGADVSVLRSRIIDNGGSDGTTPLGGLTISAKGFMDVGSTTNADANKICGNRKYNGGTPTAQEINDTRTSGTQISADYNYWGQSTGPVAGEITGNVNTSPYRTTDPFSGTACPAY